MYTRTQNNEPQSSQLCEDVHWFSFIADSTTVVYMTIYRESEWTRSKSGERNYIRFECTAVCLQLEVQTSESYEGSKVNRISIGATLFTRSMHD